MPATAPALAYPSDLTDAQWKRIRRFIPPPKPGGRPREVDMRTILNGIFYIVRAGCAWRMVPREFGPWSTVYYYFREFRRQGIWQRIHSALHKQVRKANGRKPTPSAAILDSQTVKTTEKGGLAAMTPAKRSRAASAISLSTPWD